MEFAKYYILSVLYLLCFAVLLSSSNRTSIDPEYLEMLYRTGQYKAFSQQLNIDDVNLVAPSRSEDGLMFSKGDCDPMFNKELEFGDMLLAPFQRSVVSRTPDVLHFSTLKWDGYTVPYTIIKDGYSQSDISLILLAIYTWNTSVKNIKFRRRIDEEDYVVIFSGNGCYSNLGWVSGPQSISLSSKGCMKNGTILHEMAHTVGLVHEHIRPDRDLYIEILDGNIPDVWKSQYEKTDYSGHDVLGKYDYYSVMHYRLRAPETKQPAFQILQEGVDPSRIGQRNYLTDLDIGKIRKLYC